MYEVIFEFFIDPDPDHGYECALYLNDEERQQAIEVLRKNKDAQFKDLPAELYHAFELAAVHQMEDPDRGPYPRGRMALQEWMPEDLVNLVKMSGENQKNNANMKVATENEHKVFVAEYKKTHKVLNLQIKQVYLTEILNGTKKQEFREIRPTTEAKLVERDEKHYVIEDEERYITYTDTIEVDVERDENGKLYVLDYVEDERPDRYPIYMAKTDAGVEYEAVDFDGQTYEVVRARNKNGEDALDENGLPIMAMLSPEKLNCSVPIKYDAINFYIGNTPNTDHALVKVKDIHTEFVVDDDDKPIWYEYKGEPYYVEQVVYDLGEIICEYRK